MDLNSLIMWLRKEIKDIHLFKFYLFGSAKTSNNPNDIDLLIIYNKNCPIEYAIDFRYKISQVIYQLYMLKSDIILFSEYEAQNNSFISDENCVYLDIFHTI